MLGEIFYKRRNRDGKYRDAEDVTAHANHLGTLLDIPALSNEFVTVVAGPLFEYTPEFHLRATKNFITPVPEEVTVHAEFTRYWRKTAPFHGVPFKAGITADQINMVLDTFGAERRIAVTVVKVKPSVTKEGVKHPGVMLIGADPVVIASSINSAVAAPRKKKGKSSGQSRRVEPNYAKLGYKFARGEVDVLCSSYHIGVADLLQKDSDIAKLLEVRIIVCEGGT